MSATCSKGDGECDKSAKFANNLFRFPVVDTWLMDGRG